MPDEPNRARRIRTTIRGRFVEDGWVRVRSAAEPEIRAQVVAEYAEELEAADAWGRFLLRRKIERGIQARVEKLAPPDALY